MRVLALLQKLLARVLRHPVQSLKVSARAQPQKHAVLLKDPWRQCAQPFAYPPRNRAALKRDCQRVLERKPRVHADTAGQRSAVRTRPVH